MTRETARSPLTSGRKMLKKFSSSFHFLNGQSLLPFIGGNTNQTSPTCPPLSSSCKYSNYVSRHHRNGGNVLRLYLYFEACFIFPIIFFFSAGS